MFIPGFLTTSCTETIPPHHFMHRNHTLNSQPKCATEVSYCMVPSLLGYPLPPGRLTGSPGLAGTSQGSPGPVYNPFEKAHRVPDSASLLVGGSVSRGLVSESGAPLIEARIQPGARSQHGLEGKPLRGQVGLGCPHQFDYEYFLLRL